LHASLFQTKKLTKILTPNAQTSLGHTLIKRKLIGYKEGITILRRRGDRAVFRDKNISRSSESPIAILQFLEAVMVLVIFNNFLITHQFELMCEKEEMSHTVLKRSDEPEKFVFSIFQIPRLKLS